ncbi:unnamed protein product [Amoebophrya sp. A120]|nr:unnamed protein product [Amoebophrya sp. A120]|eukprot:GSA120T00020082001.1
MPINLAASVPPGSKMRLGNYTSFHLSTRTLFAGANRNITHHQATTRRTVATTSFLGTRPSSIFFRACSGEGARKNATATSYTSTRTLSTSGAARRAGEENQNQGRFYNNNQSGRSSWKSSSNGDQNFRFTSAGADFGTPVLLGAAGAASVALTLILFPFAPARNLEEVKNEALVFLKPHAQTAGARKAVAAEMRARGLQILQEGMISGREIDQKQLIDTHYYAIASKATLLDPKQLNVPKEMFQKKFGLPWDDALKRGIVLNAKQACERLNLTSEELNTIWAKAKKDGKLVKFGGGFYCGKLENVGVNDSETLYVMNGFFMSMRQKFVEPGSSIYYWIVKWDAKKMPWEDFRGKLLGPTDPITAPPDSLRGMFMTNWREYGLSSPPDVGDNAVHASASPFEALAEKMNWLGVKPENDSFGKQVLKVIGSTVLNSWRNDPAVVYGPTPIKKSVFDTLEDADCAYCLALLSMMFTTCYWDKL